MFSYSARYFIRFSFRLLGQNRCVENGEGIEAKGGNREKRRATKRKKQRATERTEENKRQRE